MHLLTEKEDVKIDMDFFNKLITPQKVNYKNEYGDTPLLEVKIFIIFKYIPFKIYMHKFINVLKGVQIKQTSKFFRNCYYSR